MAAIVPNRYRRGDTLVTHPHPEDVVIAGNDIQIEGDESSKRVCAGAESAEDVGDPL